MKIKVTVKGQKDPIIYSGDRIDVLDFEMNGEMYKQIRYFRKGFSKSELLKADLITKIIEVGKINVLDNAFIFLFKIKLIKFIC